MNRHTEIETTKAVMNAAGEWVRVPMVLIRTAKGWAERPLQEIRA
jgi:hypothetical protein